MNEARAADLEAIETARLESQNHSAGETHATGLRVGGVKLRARDGRELRLLEPAVNNSGLSATDKNRQRMGSPCERVQKSRRVVAENEWVFDHWTPGSVGRW